MSKNILVISSSPRKGGNSDLLCDEFARGAQESGNTVEKIRLTDKKINYCTGCGACDASHSCVQRDDMAELLDKLIAADAIVLATPVYFYSVSAQLKTMIDRCAARYTEIAGKDFYFIMTAADTEDTLLKRVVSALHGFTEDCLPDSREKGVLYATGVHDKGDVTGTPYMKAAYEMGRGA